MVGSMPRADRAGQIGFASEGQAIALVGAFAPSLEASELAKLRGEALPDGLPESRSPMPSPRSLRSARPYARVPWRALTTSPRAGSPWRSRSAAGRRIGARVALELEDLAAEEALFGEAPGGFLVSGPEEALRRLAAVTPVRLLGSVGGADRSRSTWAASGLALALEALARAHAGGLAEYFA